MNKHSNFNDWNSFYSYQANRGVKEEVLELSKQIIDDIKLDFNLHDNDFSLSNEMVTYYVNNNIFGNIRINKNSLRIEPLFAGKSEYGYKIQPDGYIVHSIRIDNSNEYQHNRVLVFDLLKCVYGMKKDGAYEEFIDKFSLKLEKYLRKRKT